MKIYAVKHSYSDGDPYEPDEGLEYEDFYLNKENARKRLKDISAMAKNRTEEINTELCIICGLDIDPKTIKFKGEDWLEFDEFGVTHFFEVVTIETKD